MNIIITSAGRRVSLVRGFQKELKELFPYSQVYASDSEPETSAACRVADGYVKVPLLDSPDYIDHLLRLCIQLNISMLIPTIDTELMILATNRDRFEAKNIKVIISSPEFIAKCRNKRMVHEFLKSRGIPIAKEYSKDDYTFPLYIKPIDGSGSINNSVIRSQDDFNAGHFNNEKLMFLEYLDHNEYDEFTCDLYYDKNGSLQCAVPRKRIKLRAGEVNKGVTLNNELVPYLLEHLNKIEGARGCLTAQFFKHKTSNKIYGIEINPRFGGGYPLSYLAGANFQKWLIQEYLLDIEINKKFDTWESNLLMIRYDDEILVHGYKG